ncbi:MAG: phosphotransferase [Bdellovibrionales bacterium]|nr:phosphotransferase [Bdellovibrionales bacterium]
MTLSELKKTGLSQEALDFLNLAFEEGSFEVLPLAGDASMRRYFRIIYADKSYVLMVWEPFQLPDEYPFLNILKHFEKHKVNVPEVLRLSPEKGLILLEDLGDLTLERKFWESQDQTTTLPFYFQAVDELIKIHFAATDDRVDNCTAFKIKFDTEKFLWEMNYARKNLLEQICNTPLSEAQHKTLDRCFQDICTRLDQAPKRISHRDYHSRNLMLKLGQMRVIDFQDARLGPVQYDLVSLIHDSYVKLNKSSEQAILSDYLDKAKTFGFHQSLDEFMEIYHLQKVQRCFKACGSFSSFYNLRKDTRYLKYIVPTVQKVKRTLEIFPEYGEFLSILKGHKVNELDIEELCAQ